MDESAEHLQRLNPEQLRAVTSVEGPLLILAGAGSGKTRVLTRRIAHLLYVGIDPRTVLAVTFTNKAAAEMKERVRELVGEVADRVWVSTFHATCARILRMDIEPLGFTKRFAIYDDDDQLRLLKAIVADCGYDSDRVAPSDMRSRIDHFKNRGLGPDEVLEQRRSHVGDPLIRVWRVYEEALRAADALDFNDLIGRVVELFDKHPEVLARWCERFHFVLVDEYQDTNRVQYRLLRQLTEVHGNLAVVGDDDQSIYGFRGADVSNILSFREHYSDAQVIRLEQNYRSTAHILTLANAVVSHNPDRMEKRLWTDSDSGTRVQLIVMSTIREEAQRVAEGISKLKRHGHALSEIAVIYRTNATARFFEAALRSARIAHRVVGGRRFYDRREVRDLLAFLRLVVNPLDDAAFLRVVNVPPRGVGPKSQVALRDEAAEKGIALMACARARGPGSKVGEKGVKAFAALIDELSELARHADLSDVVEGVARLSGYRASLQADLEKSGEQSRDAESRIRNVDALIDDASSFEMHGRQGSPMDRLSAWLDRSSLASAADQGSEEGEVTLMTVHASKGLEFPIVFVVQMNEGAFPHERSLDVGIEEERRLAYVAFTRAMKRLVVTRSRRKPASGPGAMGAIAQPSRFLFDLPEEACDGDMPNGDSVSDAGTARRQAVATSATKLAVFLEQQQEEPTFENDQPHTLLDIEGIHQLKPGVWIHHVSHGVGRIKNVAGQRLRVSFGSRELTVPMSGETLQLVQSDPM